MLLLRSVPRSDQNFTYKEEEAELSNTPDYFWCTHFKPVIEFMIMIEKINSWETSVTQETEKKKPSPGQAPYSSMYKTL